MKLLSRMNLLMMAFLAVIALGAVSCSDDDDKGNGGGTPPDPAPSDMTPAQHKQNLEKTATKVLALFNPDLQKVAIQNTAQFLGLVGAFSSDDEVMEPVPVNPVTQALIAAYSTAKGESDALIGLSEALLQNNEGLDLTSFYGIYTYDPAIQDFVRTEATDRMEYRFPGVGSQTNNAVLVGTVTSSETVIEGVKIPSALNVIMTVGETRQLSVDFKYTASSTGNSNDKVTVSVIIANNLTASLEMQTNMTQSPVPVAGTVTLAVAGNGKSTGATVTDVMSATFNTGLILPGQNNSEMAVKSGEVNVTIQDILLAAKADMAKLGQAIAEYKKNNPAPTTDEARLKYMEGLCAVYNANASIILSYNNKNKDKIADCKMYAIEDYSYNGPDGKVTYYDMAPQLIFSDGSKIDFETYFGTGFESVIRKVYELGGKYEDMMP